jgi:hypothetical protein
LSEPKKPIVISADDLNRDSVVATVRSIQQAQNVPLVRQIGEETKSNDGILTIVFLTLGGLAGGLLAWIVTRLTPDFDEVQVSNIVFSVTVGLAVALALVVTEGIRSQSWAKFGNSLLISGPSALGLALGLGFMASVIYGVMVDATVEAIERSGLDPFWDSDQFVEEFMNRNHLNRGIAWSFLGLAAGISVGLAGKSIKRVLITGGGGLAGGFLGGFMFDYFEGESLAQAFGLGLTGLIIGLTVSLLEQAVKSSWLEIVSGGMAGKQFIIYQDEVTLGSSPSANITLIKDTAIAPIAAQIVKSGSVFKVRATIESGSVLVDGVQGTSFELREGSSIQIGQTVLRFRAKARKVQNVGITRG